MVLGLRPFRKNDDAGGLVISYSFLAKKAEATRPIAATKVQSASMAQGAFQDFYNMPVPNEFITEHGNRRRSHNDQ